MELIYLGLFSAEAPVRKLRIPLLTLRERKPVYRPCESLPWHPPSCIEGNVGILALVVPSSLDVRHKRMSGFPATAPPAPSEWPPTAINPVYSLEEESISDKTRHAVHYFPSSIAWLTDPEVVASFNKTRSGPDRVYIKMIRRFVQQQ